MSGLIGIKLGFENEETTNLIDINDIELLDLDNINKCIYYRQDIFDEFEMIGRALIRFKNKANKPYGCIYDDGALLFDRIQRFNDINKIILFYENNSEKHYRVDWKDGCLENNEYQVSELVIEGPKHTYLEVEISDIYDLDNGLDDDLLD